MNSHQTFTNQELFTFCFKDQQPRHSHQFQLALQSDFEEASKKMLEEDKDHRLKLEDFTRFQLNVDVGIMMFYCTFVRVMPPVKRIEFLEWQLARAKHKPSFLYRLESLATTNYWYHYGPNSHYDREVEDLVSKWITDKIKGSSSPIKLYKA